MGFNDILLATFHFCGSAENYPRTKLLDHTLKHQVRYHRDTLHSFFQQLSGSKEAFFKLFNEKLQKRWTTRKKKEEKLTGWNLFVVVGLVKK